MITTEEAALQKARVYRILDPQSSSVLGSWRALACFL